MPNLTNLRYPGDDKIDKARLAILGAELKKLAAEIKLRDPRDQNKQMAKAKALAPAVAQLIKDARDDYIQSRLKAVKQVYKIYGDLYEEVTKLPEAKKKRIKTPESVKVVGNLKSKLKGSRKRELTAGYDGLIKEMKKPANYSHTSVDGQFKPNFNKHDSHVTGNGNEWKAYIEEGTTNTKWRLYFKMTFDESDDSLTVNLTKVQEDH